MGISEGLHEGVEVDCTAGTIVWVRRRNGSWWPGKILGLEELSASHLMSPRSGTPVKLLGRDDASVDWYNLEKSKRVKAFRCGDFDACIERAESSQGIPIKKREKYARREDAILHALELEKLQLEKKQQIFGVTSNGMNETLGRLENILDCSETADPQTLIKHRSHPHSKRSDSSLEEESLENALFSQKGRHLRQPSWGDDNSEAIPRMRGLQDFGLRIARSKRKLSTPASHDNCQDHVSNGRSFSTFKRKRSHGGFTEELLIKRRDRRRPLLQVLRSSAKLPPSCHLPSDGDALSMSAPGNKEQVGVICRAKRSKCIYLPTDDCSNQIEFHSQTQQSGHFVEENACSGSSSGDDSDPSEKDCSVPVIEEEAALHSGSDPLVLTVDGPSNSAKSMERRPSNELEELDESPFSSYDSQLHPHEQAGGISANVGGSKWQLKGKRKSRNLSRRPMEAIGSTNPLITADKSNETTPGELYENEESTLVTPSAGHRVSRPGVHGRNDVFSHTYNEGDLIENDLVQASTLAYGDRRYPFIFKASKRDRERSRHDITDSDEGSLASLTGYWEESDEGFNPIYVGHLGHRMDAMLVDVELKVQASYQGERVPLVSLMSRLNGKAIVGHPVQIETMEDGSSALLLSTTDFIVESLADNDANAGLPPVWRTARRTTMHRIRRPPPSAIDDEETDHQSSDFETKTRLYIDQLNHKTRLLKNSHGRGTLADKKYSRKQLNKANLGCQKTRTLSSFAVEQRFNNLEPTHTSGSLIKPEGLAPSIACVPVKLVFSRILEAVGRPPYR